MKPVIGIVAKPATEIDMWHYMGVVDEIRAVLVKNGALAVGVLPAEGRVEFKLDEEPDNYVLTEDEKHDLGAILDRLDGVVLEGGLVSNQYEEEIAKLCLARDMPILGICSGFNNFVRALGGKVYIDANTFHNQFGVKIAHEVEIVEDSRLFEILREKRMKVNSIHTCIAKEEELANCVAVAKCPLDDTVEAVEVRGKKFAMGIKWHPELMGSMDPIFAEFIGACRKNES